MARDKGLLSGPQIRHWIRAGAPLAKATAAKDWTVREMVKDYRAKKLVSLAYSTQVSYGRHPEPVEKRLGARVTSCPSKLRHHVSHSGKVRNPYFTDIAMLAKITSKNQLTLPKSVTQAVGPAEYFDVQTRDGEIVLTPVRIQRGDAVRAKLAELNLTETDIGDAVAWARTSAQPKTPAKSAATTRTQTRRKA